MQKTLFKKIIVVVAIILPTLPFLVTFSSLLTSVFNKMGWYVWLQNIIVPFESKLVAVIIKVFGINATVYSGATFSMGLERPGEGMLPVVMEWNCLGWQSMILLILTLVTGLRGDYSFTNKIEVAVFGILGTFLSNLFRMAIIVALAFYWNDIAAMIIHDYFASFVAIIWFVFFWWFSYSYILESKSIEV